MTGNDMAKNRKRPSLDAREEETSLRSWKKTWRAETATFDEARLLRRRLVKLWRQGSDRERETARIVRRCKKGQHCGSAECPVCERRRCRKALRNRPTHIRSVAVTETAVPQKEPVEAPKPVLLLEIGAPADITEIPSLMPALGEVAGSAEPRKEIDQANRVLRSLVDQNVDPFSAPIPFHPFAEIFPMLDDDRLNDLVQDIKDHGLLDAIVLYEGKILDGRCRYRACKIAGIEPRFESYAGADTLGFVVSRNLQRRHLNESQRAMVAARLADLRRGANQHSEGLPIGAASKLMNVSPRSTARAREVLVHGDTELMAAVESGDLTVAAAAALSRKQTTTSSDGTEVGVASPTTSSDEGSKRAEEPSPNGTMIEAASVPVGFPSAMMMPPVGEVSSEPTFRLPQPGVTFLVGGLTAAVSEVAVKIGATVSAGAEWPNNSYAEIGEVVWLSSQSRAEEILHRQFEAAQALLPGVRFLEAELDNFGLSIRNLSEDFRRLYHLMASERRVKLVVLDYFSEYLRFREAGRIIPSFEYAVGALQEFAAKQGVAVVLPCQLSTRDERTVSEAVSAVQSLRFVNAVYFIKRDVKPNRGTLVHVTENVGLDAPGFSFQLRNWNCVPAVVWDGLRRDQRMW